MQKKRCIKTRKKQAIKFKFKILILGKIKRNLGMHKKAEHKVL